MSGGSAKLSKAVRELVSSRELVPETQAVGSRSNGAACRWWWPWWVPYRNLTRQYTNKTGSEARASETRGRNGKRYSDRATTSNSQVMQRGVPGLWGAGPDTCSGLNTGPVEMNASGPEHSWEVSTPLQLLLDIMCRIPSSLNCSHQNLILRIPLAPVGNS